MVTVWEIREEYGYEHCRSGGRYYLPYRRGTCDAESVDAWLAGAKRAGEEAYKAGKDLETEAVKIKDPDTRVAFRSGYPDEALVPARKESDVPEWAQPEKLPNGNTGVDATLAERGSRYGIFANHAEITQRLKDTMWDHRGWAHLSDDQKEALEMIAHKIGRILNGDPNYPDSWHDIAGYAKLVDDRLNGVSK